jgi:hypothetical protein
MIALLGAAAVAINSTAVIASLEKARQSMYF